MYILTQVSLSEEAHWNRKSKLIAYMSKRLPEVANNYYNIELELCGLAINVANLSRLLSRDDFDAIVDHLALTHIMKSKQNQPPLE